TPLAPLWMCACIAGPVSFANVSFHFSVCPLSVPLNKPCAAASLTTCFGTSWPELSAAVQTVVWAAPNESAASASAQTAPAANNDTSLLILSSSPGRWPTLVVSPGNSVELGLRFALRKRPQPRDRQPVLVDAGGDKMLAPSRVKGRLSEYSKGPEGGAVAVCLASTATAAGARPAPICASQRSAL